MKTRYNGDYSNIEHNYDNHILSNPERFVESEKEALKRRIVALECYATQLENGTKDLLHQVANLEACVRAHEMLRNARDGQI